MERGTLFVVSAPSGAGKTTLVRRVLAADGGIGFSVSFTTRPRRRTETHGKDYFFVDDAEFSRLKAENAFLEYARVFDYWYGTSRSQVDDMLAEGRNAILEIDWQGARQVRENMPESVGIFVLPPSVGILEQRLRTRKTDSDAVIERRLNDARDDISHWHEFDFVVVNDDLDAATDALRAIIGGEGDPWSSAETRVRDLASEIEAG